MSCRTKKFLLRYIFFMVKKNRILTKVIFFKENGKIVVNLFFCQEEETPYHLFVQCPYINTI
jgi:hypothetical protein